MQEVINDREVVVYVGEMEAVELEELATAYRTAVLLAQARDRFRARAAASPVPLSGEAGEWVTPAEQNYAT